MIGRRRVSFALLWLLISGFTSAVLALAGSYPKGGAHGSSEWPAGLRELANSEGNLGGYFVNANDWIHFAGDTSTLNRFLERYAKLQQTPLRVVIRFDEKPAAGQLGPAEHFDWTLSVLRRGWGAPPAPPGTSGKYVVTVTVWVDEHVQLDDLYLFGAIAPIVVPTKYRPRA